MKINLTKNQINFGKTLVAKCDLPRQNHKKVECNIFKLNSDEDSDYFEKLWKSKSWQDAKYLCDMNAELNADIPDERIYVLESQAGRCLGYIAMTPNLNNPKHEELVFLETCPKYQNSKAKRPLRYIGETLLAFATEQIDTSKTKAVVVKEYSQEGKPFYIKNCGFKERDDENRTLLLRRKDFKNLTKRNEIHTKSKIQYIV